MSGDERAARDRYADLAVEALEAAINAGWSEFEYLQQDLDLNSIRDHLGYKRLMMRAESSKPTGDEGHDDP